MCTCPESTHNVTSSPEANGASGLSSSSTTRTWLSPTLIVTTSVPAIVFKYRTWPVRGYLAEVIMALFSFRTDSATPAPQYSGYQRPIRSSAVSSVFIKGGDYIGTKLNFLLRYALTKQW